jgi:hypothetical protein
VPDLESDEIKQSLLQLCETTLMDELKETLIKDMTQDNSELQLIDLLEVFRNEDDAEDP